MEHQINYMYHAFFVDHGVSIIYREKSIIIVIVEKRDKENMPS